MGAVREGEAPMWPLFSAHTEVLPVHSPDGVGRRIAEQLHGAERLCPDASDVMPPTVGRLCCEKVLEFLADPLQERGGPAGGDPAVPGPAPARAGPGTGLRLTPVQALPFTPPPFTPSPFSPSPFSPPRRARPRRRPARCRAPRPRPAAACTRTPRPGPSRRRW